MRAVKPIDIVVEHRGQQFKYSLCRRDLSIGGAPDAGPCKYYWMDSRQFRQGRGGPNFRPCVDFWWTAVEEAGATEELDNQWTLVMAECYPLISASKAVQDVFVDAHLPHNAERELTLPEETTRSLRAMVEERDVSRIATEFDRLFLGQLPPTDELPRFRRAADVIIHHGIEALETEGPQGVRNFAMGFVKDWISENRKRGAQPEMRALLNMFSYECNSHRSGEICMKTTGCWCCPQTATFAIR